MGPRGKPGKGKSPRTSDARPHACVSIPWARALRGLPAHPGEHVLENGVGRTARALQCEIRLLDDEEPTLELPRLERLELLLVLPCTKRREYARATGGFVDAGPLIQG